MSALAKFYASRGMDLADDGLPARANGMALAASSTSNLAVLRRKTEGEVKEAHQGEFKVDDKVARKDKSARAYTSALDVLETVNSGLVDVFDRLQRAETMRDQLIAECEQQDEKMHQFESALDGARTRYEAAESQNSDLAERLISETARASVLEQRVAHADEALEEADTRIEELEEVCKVLHDGIYTVFGTGSPTQKALSTLSK